MSSKGYVRTSSTGILTRNLRSISKARSPGDLTVIRCGLGLLHPGLYGHTFEYVTSSPRRMILNQTVRRNVADHPEDQKVTASRSREHDAEDEQAATAQQ